MSIRKAAIDFSAADSSLRVSSVPITILGCLLVCPEQDSLQRYSQTSGPRRRDERMRLPFCMVAPLFRWLYRHNIGTKWGSSLWSAVSGGRWPGLTGGLEGLFKPSALV